MKDKTILITGGTGTVGRALVSHLLETYPEVGKVIVYSRDEQKHYDMTQAFSPLKYPVQFIVGDIRDRNRIMMACRNVDIVVHTAAMKHVPVSESNPIECARTNILGSQNVIDAALVNGVKRVVAVSSDKAVSPINAYGASKLFLERLFLDANRTGETRFSVVRYANVFGSKGSVVPFFMKQQAQGFLPITDPDMTRFSITMKEGLDLILFAIEQGWGGEIVVPISPSYRILDVAAAIASDLEHRIVGIRPGEKLHEAMVGDYESARTVRNGCFYVVCPENDDWDIEKYCSTLEVEPVANGFSYNSGSNADWMTINDIRNLLQTQNYYFRAIS